MNLPIAVAFLLGRTTKEFQFPGETFLVADGGSSVYQGLEHGMFIGRVVV
jgi:hypothetical protein